MRESEQALQAAVTTLTSAPNEEVRRGVLAGLDDFIIHQVSESFLVPVEISHAADTEKSRRLTDPSRYIPLEAIFYWSEFLGGSSLEGKDGEFLANVSQAIARSVPHENPEGVARGLARYIWTQLDDAVWLLDEALSYCSDMNTVANLTVEYATQRRSYLSREGLNDTMQRKITSAKRIKAEREAQAKLTQN